MSETEVKKEEDVIVHLYASVRVKLQGTFKVPTDPAGVADRLGGIADDNMELVRRVVENPQGHKETVEFADEISSILIDYPNDHEFSRTQDFILAEGEYIPGIKFNLSRIMREHAAMKTLLEGLVDGTSYAGTTYGFQLNKFPTAVRELLDKMRRKAL